MAGRKLATLKQFVLLVVFNPFSFVGGTREEDSKSQTRQKGFVLCRQLKPDTGFAWYAFGADFTAVGLNQLLDNRQADPCTSGLAGAGRVGSEESFKNKRQILLGNTCPAVDKIGAN